MKRVNELARLKNNLLFRRCHKTLKLSQGHGKYQGLVAMVG
jgi:hypothetical protein